MTYEKNLAFQEACYVFLRKFQNKKGKTGRVEDSDKEEYDYLMKKAGFDPSERVVEAQFERIRCVDPVKETKNVGSRVKKLKGN